MVTRKKAIEAQVEDTGESGTVEVEVTPDEHMHEFVHEFVAFMPDKRIEDTVDEQEYHPVKQIADSPVNKTLEALREQAKGIHQDAVDKVMAAKDALNSAEAELTEIEGFMGIQKPVISEMQRATRSSSGPTGRTNAPRGFWKSKILEALQGSPDGLKKNELIDATGVAGNIKQMANISSALQMLKKNSEVGQTEEGRYTLP